MEQFEHNPSDHEDPLTGPTWLVGFIGFILLNVVFLGVTSLFFTAEQEEVVVQDFGKEFQDVEKLHREQLEQIDSKKWPARLRPLGEGEERIVIPIEMAMQKIVEEYGAPE